MKVPRGGINRLLQYSELSRVRVHEASISPRLTNMTNAQVETQISTAGTRNLTISKTSAHTNGYPHSGDGINMLPAILNRS